MEQLFREESQAIYIFVYRETLDDPEEKNKILTKTCNGIPIQAIVSDILPDRIAWKMPGVHTERAKELTVKATKLTLLNMSHKIRIDGHDYVGWKDNSKLQTMKLDGTYIKVYVYSK